MSNLNNEEEKFESSNLEVRSCLRCSSATFEDLCSFCRQDEIVERDLERLDKKRRKRNSYIRALIVATFISGYIINQNFSFETVIKNTRKQENKSFEEVKIINALKKDEKVNKIVYPTMDRVKISDYYSVNEFIEGNLFYLTCDTNLGATVDIAIPINTSAPNKNVFLTSREGVESCDKYLLISDGYNYLTSDVIQHGDSPYSLLTTDLIIDGFNISSDDKFINNSKLNELFFDGTKYVLTKFMENRGQLSYTRYIFKDEEFYAMIIKNSTEIIMAKDLCQRVLQCR